MLLGFVLLTLVVEGIFFGCSSEDPDNFLFKKAACLSLRGSIALLVVKFNRVDIIVLGGTELLPGAVSLIILPAEGISSGFPKDGSDIFLLTKSAQGVDGATDHWVRSGQQRIVDESGDRIAPGVLIFILWAINNSALNSSEDDKLQNCHLVP